METSNAPQPDDTGFGETRSRRTKKGVLLSNIPKRHLEQLFHLPLEAAAEELGLGLTAMKTLCRQHNLSRWPYRKMQSLKRFQAVLIAGTCSEDDLFRIYQLVKSVGLPLNHPLWKTYLHVDMEAAIGEYARQHSVLSAAMRTTSEAPSTNNSSLPNSASGIARSGSTAAPASVIRIPVANAVSHLSGDMGAPSGPPPPRGALLAARGSPRKPSSTMMRIVSGAGYDEPSEVAEREGSAMEGPPLEGSGDSPPRPAPTERSDITGLQTTISRVSTLHPTRLKAPKQPAVAATEADGCECGCVSQPVVGKAAAGEKTAAAPEKCVQCGGVSRTAPSKGAACGHHPSKAACGGEDKVVVDKQKLLKLLQDLQADTKTAVDVDTWLEALKP